MVVDGSKVVRKMIEGVLRQQLPNMEFVGCESGQEAKAALQAGAVNLVTTALRLPDIDGLEVARRLKSIHGDACPRLIALSGWGQERDKQRAREAGFERHFTKPVDPSTIAAVLDRAPDRDTQPA